MEIRLKVYKVYPRTFGSDSTLIREQTFLNYKDKWWERIEETKVTVVDRPITLMCVCVCGWVVGWVNILTLCDNYGTWSASGSARAAFVTEGRGVD